MGLIFITTPFLLFVDTFVKNFLFFPDSQLLELSMDQSLQQLHVGPNAPTNCQSAP
jgi:hypothetical protein